MMLFSHRVLHMSSASYPINVAFPFFCIRALKQMLKQSFQSVSRHMIYHGPQVVLPSAIQCSALLFWSLACIVVTKPTEWSSRHCYFCTLDFLIIVLLCPVFSGLVRPFLWEAVIHTCDGPGFCNVCYDWITVYSIGLGLAGLNSSVCTYCPHF